MLGVLVFLIGVEGTVAYAVVTFLASILVAALWSKLGLDSDVKPLGRAAAPGCEISPPARASVWRQAWRDTWAFFVPAVPYLLVGTAAGAVIYGFVPTGWIIALAGPSQPFAIPLAAALGIPVYVNAETFFPISAALLEKGVGVGAVVALIITSMGVSVPEVALLTRLFRLRLVAILVVSVFALAIGAGTIFALTIS
jgi:hypothetical protein